MKGEIEIIRWQTKIMWKKKKIRRVRWERNRRYSKKLSKFKKKNITDFFYFLSYTVHNRIALQEMYLFLLIWLGKVLAYTSERLTAATSWLTTEFKMLSVCVQSIMYYGTVWYTISNVWAEPSAFTYITDASSSTLNMEAASFSETCLPNRTASHPIRKYVSYAQPWEPRIKFTKSLQYTSWDVTRNGDIVGDLPWHTL